MFTMNWRRWTRLDLKDQYFGCEIEMTGITREQAAQAVAALFGTTARQTHESHTYDPWEVTDGVGKKWRFVYDGSIETTRRECGRQAAAHDRRYSVEMNSPKLEYSEMKKLQEVIRALRHAGAVVNESCGMHVHVDASGHTPHSLRNALSIMYSKEDILFRAIGAKPDRISQYCQYSRENVVRTVRALSPHLTMEQLKQAWYGGRDGSFDHYNWTRYYGLELMLAVFDIVQGIVSRAMGAAGTGGLTSTTLPQEIVDKINAVGFWSSIPLWAVTLLGGLFITVLSFVMIMTVYGRMFRLYFYAALAPIPLAAFAGEPTSSVGRSFVKSYAGVCLEGAVIALACIIFSAMASAPPAVDNSVSAVTAVWSYVAELLFDLLILVGAVKASDRVVREMMGL